jgi:cytochrome P450
MKVSSIIPDAMPPGVRGLAYGGFCWLNRHPGVLRAIGALLRFLPSMAGRFGLVVRASAVKSVLTRPESFSNTAHEPNMVAGDFMIGMDPGPTYAADRALLESRFGSLHVRTDADGEAQALAPALCARLRQPEANASFDLIDDYLMWVAFRAIQPVFGSAAYEVAAGAGGDTEDRGLQHQYLLEIRYVAGQLLAGDLSTLRVQRRADVCADSLRARIKGVRGDIEKAWHVSISSADIERNAVGLAWISHPVTVQSGALVVQELLSRPEIYRNLRSMSQKIGKTDVWTDNDFRNVVRDHVLELMRFRPIFPLLARDVPRDTEFETGGRKNAQCRAGGKLAIWSIAAMFDSRAVSDSGRFCPHREWQDEEFRWMMFGYGDRHCPARHYAVEIITSALIGLLTLPELQLADAITYDGPLMSRMRMRVAKG